MQLCPMCKLNGFECQCTRAEPFVGEVIMGGQRPDAPDWFKEGREPDWSIKLQREYWENARNINEEFVKKFEKFVEEKELEKRKSNAE